ncbi:MAG TPA: YigZ family protein [Planctomycetes bacterium]|nr:YigZ family protein [Planctomycetota bacterium]
MAATYRTLAQRFRFEIDPVKGSRFLTTAAPAASEEEARAILDGVRAEFPNATHHCWALRIGPGGEVFRSSDDGEPGGSAGRPILAQIEGHGLTDVIVVVTRWFGGTKLGVGGLIRAYGGACGRTLDRAPLRTVVVTVRVRIEYPYDCSGAVEGVLRSRGLEPVASEYGEEVWVEVLVPEDEVAAVSRELADKTAGRVQARS